MSGDRFGTRQGSGWRLAAVFLVVSWTLAGLAQRDAARISLEEFKRLYDAGDVIVVDTRDAESYRAGHIPGAVLVPQDAATAKAAELKARGKLVVTYCT